MENEKIYLRKILLDTMDTYIRNVIGDEDAIAEWITWGMPDGYTDDDLTEIAEDDLNFRVMADGFQRILFDYDYTNKED